VRLSPFQLTTLASYVDRLTESRRNADQWTIAVDSLIVSCGIGDAERLVRLVWDHSIRMYEVEFPIPPLPEWRRTILPPLRVVGAM
jgi:hypothetical protein